MKTYERIEQEEARADVVEGGHEALLVGDEVEAQDGDGDDEEVEGREGEPAVVAQGLDARADGGEGVFGEIDESGAGVVDGEAAEAGGVGGDAGRQIEAEPGLPALGGAADDAQGAAGPDLLDEPVALGGIGRQFGDAEKGERIG